MNTAWRLPFDVGIWASPQRSTRHSVVPTAGEGSTIHMWNTCFSQNCHWQALRTPFSHEEIELQKVWVTSPLGKWVRIWTQLCHAPKPLIYFPQHAECSSQAEPAPGFLPATALRPVSRKMKKHEFWVQAIPGYEVLCLYFMLVTFVLMFLSEEHRCAVE